jgi:S-adenosylmethionine decarboxylase
MKTVSTVKHFGVHLVFDGYSCPLEKLNNRELVEKFLVKVAEDLKMRALSAPHVLKAPGDTAKDPGGYSGFIIIAESHISVHTFDKRGFVSVDIYSCKDFDVEKAIKDLNSIFQPKTFETKTIIRGRHYPEENIYK